MNENTLHFLAAWAALDWLTPLRHSKILKIYSNLENAWKNIHKGDLEFLGENISNIDALLEKKKNIHPEQEFEKLKKSSIQLCYIEDKNYPKKLKEISSPPIFLYYKGTWKHDYNLALAVVGTRKVTSYGKQVTRDIVSQLSQKLTIISGLAIGVDTIAHTTSIDAGGKTLAVLGNGIDTIYPTQNKALAEKILEKDGMILSEFPPGTPPHNYNFPRRNRIISGLSLGTLIVEGQIKSGSLITAKTALEQNREVFAIPGNIYSSQSTGTNALIQKSEAKLVTKAEDIFEELNIENEESYHNAQEVFSFSSAEEEKIFSYLHYEPQDMNQIQKRCNFPIAKITSLLTFLEMKGLAENIGCGMWIRRK